MSLTHFSTKERLLTAAEQLFAEHGFAATSLRQLTGHADVNVAAVNYHFGSKENLITEVFRRRFDELSERYQSASGYRRLRPPTATSGSSSSEVSRPITP